MPLIRCFIMQVLKRYIICDEERKSIIKDISDFLDNEGAVSFAYIYGSFIKEDGFNDIDIVRILMSLSLKRRVCLTASLIWGLGLKAN